MEYVQLWIWIYGCKREKNMLKVGCTELSSPRDGYYFQLTSLHILTHSSKITIFHVPFFHDNDSKNHTASKMSLFLKSKEMLKCLENVKWKRYCCHLKSAKVFRKGIAASYCTRTLTPAGLQMDICRRFQYSGLDDAQYVPGELKICEKVKVKKNYVKVKVGMGSQLVMDDIYRRFQCSGLDDAHTICSRKAHDTFTNTNTQKMNIQIQIHKKWIHKYTNTKVLVWLMRNIF